jgi:fatty-acyl-CoA synthase
MALGIQKGDPVALWGSNCPEWVRAHCREHLPEQLFPDYIRLVDDFPMTRSGKMQEFKMREMMVEMLKKDL